MRAETLPKRALSDNEDLERAGDFMERATLFHIHRNLGDRSVVKRLETIHCHQERRYWLLRKCAAITLVPVISLRDSFTS